MSAEIVIVTNQKGGVGKSTTAEAFADGISLKGYKVLLVDLDPQCSITLTAGADMSVCTAYDVLINGVDTQKAIQERTQRADIIPSSQNLVKAEIVLPGDGKQYVLKKALGSVKNRYDYIVVDTPPSLGILTINALTASDSVIIPAQADVYSLQGIGQLYDTIETIKEHTNAELSLKGVLLTRHNARSILSRDMTELAGQTAERLGTFLYSVMIREGVAIKEAQANQQSIFAYAPRSNPSKDYKAFVDEFLKIGEMENG